MDLPRSSSSSSSHNRRTTAMNKAASRHHHGRVINNNNQNRREQQNNVELTPDFVIQKIVQHSRRDPSSPRLLKYLLHVKKTFSSSNLKLWMDLRTKGGVQSLETLVRNCRMNEDINISINPEENKDNNQLPTIKIKQDIFSCSLSILGNSYSLDYCARKDVANSGFVAVLHKLLQISEDDNHFKDCSSNKTKEPHTTNNTPIVVLEPPPFSSMECDIKTKAVKCIANLTHDTTCRDVVLKSGVGITILKMLEKFNCYWNGNKGDPANNKSSLEVGSAADIEVASRRSKAVDEFSECAKSSVRAIRILSLESRSEEAKSHLIRFGGVTTIGQVLNWAVNEDLKLDVIRSVKNLTDKIRLLPSEQVHELVSEDGDNPLLKVLITMLDKSSVDAKWFCPIIRCLTNLAGNTRLAESMGKHMVFKVALEKLHHADLKSSTEICRLLITLTKHSGVNRCLLNNCQEVYTTLQILRSDGLQEHHRWLLHVYENVYEGCLRSLLKNGLIELIHDHFKKELEDCDYDILKSKVMTLDENVCRVHGENCQFIPTYRCDSPSYQQVQEEMKCLLKDRDLHLYKMEVDSGISSGMDSSSSPSSSPTRSWSSTASSSSSSDDSGSEESGLLGMPGMPTRSNSPVSSISDNDDEDDEGCYSPVYSCLSLSPTYSEGNPTIERPEPSFSPDNNSTSPHQQQQQQHHYYRQSKRPRLDYMSQIPFLNEDQVVLTTKRISSNIGGDSLKNKSKKIVVMLNILQKVSFLSPIPSSMADIVPILLSFIVRGIVSLTPQKYKYEDYSKDDEMIKLGRRSFSLAYRILKTIFLDIKFFPELVKNGTISIISRLLCWDKMLVSSSSGAYTESMSTLLDTLRGKVTSNSNISKDTSGWREGHLLRTLLISKSEEELTNVSLTIPLLFRTNDHVLRNFESKGNSWTRVFELLTKSWDDLPLSLFQDCILTLATLCETIGMKYDSNDSADVSRRPKLLVINNNGNGKGINIDQFLQFLPLSDSKTTTITNSEYFEGKVKITLDDGSTALIQKQILTESSPVFAAMFDGYFAESGSQSVLIRNVSKESLSILVEQLLIQHVKEGSSRSSLQQQNMEVMEDKIIINTSTTNTTLDLSCLFELAALADQFLLESVYERTLNTLLSCYICPYSAPQIYAEAVRLSTLWKPQSRLEGWDMDLTFVILKFLLVGNITNSARCAAFRKIFDTVPSQTVVGDMRALVEFYSSRPQQNNR